MLARGKPDVKSSKAIFQPFLPDLLHHPATTLPRMQWVTALRAQGTGAMGKKAKCLVAKAAPKPEFCMPTSMEAARRMDSSNPLNLANRSPAAKPPE